MRKAHRPDGFRALQFAGRTQRSAALLQSLAALFSATGRHNASEILRFEELAHQLLGDVDADGRRRLAETIARLPEAPVSLIRRLAFDEAAIAAPVLRSSPVIGADDLAALADLGPDHRRALAHRGDLTAEAREALLAGNDVEIMTTLARRDLAVAYAAPGGNRRAASFPSGPAGGDGEPHMRERPDDLIALFPILEQRDRLALVERLKSDNWQPDMGAAAAMLLQFSPATADRLIASARDRDMVGFGEEIAAGLRLPAEIAARILRDQSGDMLVIALQAIGCDEAATGRIIMAARPDIGHSVERFLAVMRFYGRLTRAVAYRLIAGWLQAAAPGHRTGGDTGRKSLPARMTERHGRIAAIAPQAVFSAIGGIRRNRA